MPVNSNHRYNEYLKEICALCGLELELTTHTARHTFATTIALEHDIPLKIVSVMLGHRTQRTTEIYARASKQAISRHMSDLQKKLFGKGRALQHNNQSHPLSPTLPPANKTKKARAAGPLISSSASPSSAAQPSGHKPTASNTRDSEGAG